MFKINKKTTIIILFLILALGSFLRLYKLGSQSYWMDEGYTVNAVLSGAENGFTRSGASILDSGETYACPTYCLPTWLLGARDGENAFNFRILATIFGILAILAVFLVTKELFNNDRVSLLTAFFMATSYFQIAWSRQARWYTELTFFTWLAIYFFWKIQIQIVKGEDIAPKVKKRQSITYILSLIIVLALAIATHKLAILLPFIFVFYLFITKGKKIITEIISKRKLENKKFITYLLSLILLLILLPLMLFPNFFINAIQNIDWSYNLPYYLNFYLRNYWLFIILIVFYYFSLPKNKGNLSPISYPLLLPILFIAYLIPLSLLTGIVHYRYLFFLTPIFFILGSVAIVGLIDKIKKKSIKITFLAIFILVFLMLKAGVIIPLEEYFLESDNPVNGNRPYYAYTPQPEFKQAYQVIKDSKQPGEIIISSHPHFNKIFLDEPGYWLKYNYLGFEHDIETISNDNEYYVGAKVIDDLSELQGLIKTNHGYLVFDYMAQDNRIALDIINYIESNTNYAPLSSDIGTSLFKLLYSFQTNYYSRIWVYRF